MRSIVSGIVLGLAFLGLPVPASGESFPGFRLLHIGGYRVKWSSPVMGEGGTVTYAFATSLMEFPGARNCGRLVPADGLLARSGLTEDAFAGEVRAAFAMWEKAANITFREVNSPEKAGIVIGAQGSPGGIAFTNVEFAGGDEALPGRRAAWERAAWGPARGEEPGRVRVISRAVICFNPQARWKIGFDGNTGIFDVRYVAAHEIGHAIGLDHPYPSGALMAFRYEERFRSLQAGDANGAVVLYGRRTPASSTLAGSAGPAVSLAPVTR